MNLLLAAIEIMVVMESGGNWHAIGDGGESVGCLQIQPNVIVDVNRFIGYSKYGVEDRFDPDKSRQIAQIYLSHYCSAKRLGHEPTLNDYVRCWNGGPNYREAQGRKLRKLNEYASYAANLMEDKLAAVMLQRKKLQLVPAVKI